MKQNEKWISLLYNNDEMKMAHEEGNTHTVSEKEWRGEEIESEHLVVVSLGFERGWNFENTSRQGVYINYS